MSRLSPLNQRRWRNFKSNRRAYWSLWIFSVIFGLSLFAEVIANDKPILVQYRGEYFFSVHFRYIFATLCGGRAWPGGFRDGEQHIVGNNYIAYFGCTLQTAHAGFGRPCFRHRIPLVALYRMDRFSAPGVYSEAPSTCYVGFTNYGSHEVRTPLQE